MERHTRTERHLEQYSNIGDQYYKDQARKKQSVREKQVVDLKDNILGNKDKLTHHEQFENLVDNYESSEGYMRKNFDNMDEEQINNMGKKQQNRRIQMQNMLSEIYQAVYMHNTYWGNGEIQDFFRYILGTVYAEPVDARKKIDDDAIWRMIKKTILDDDYDDVLTIIEAIVQY